MKRKFRLQGTSVLGTSRGGGKSARRRCGTQFDERALYREICGKFSDVRSHSMMPNVVKAERIHFVHSTIRRPVLPRNAVRRHHDSCSVGTIVAVHKNLLIRIVPEEL